MLWFVSSVLLAVHLLAVNLASGGPLVAAWLLGCSDSDAQLARRMLRWCLGGLAYGALLGGVTLILPGLGLVEALRRFPARAYWIAGGELIFSAVCVAALLVGHAWFRRRRVATWLVAIATSTNLLYHFLPWLSVIGRLAIEPAWGPPGMIDRHELLKLMATSEPLSLSVHAALASVAVPAVAALWTFRKREASEAAASDPSGTRTIRGLATWALAPTLLQLPAGLWLLAAATPRVRDNVMGGDPVAAICFAAGVLTALFLMHLLVALVMGECDGALIRRTGWTLVATVTLMSGTLRGARMAPASAPSPAPLRASNDAPPLQRNP